MIAGHGRTLHAKRINRFLFPGVQNVSKIVSPGGQNDVVSVLGGIETHISACIIIDLFRQRAQAIFA